MKTLKAICTAAVLALALSVTAYAADIHTPGLTAAGEIGTPGATQPAPAPGDIETPGVASPAPGDVSTPGLTAVLLTIAALF
jgi:hypothetical protein